MSATRVRAANGWPVRLNATNGRRDAGIQLRGRATAQTGCPRILGLVSNSRSAACAIGLNPGKHPCSERCRHFGCSAHGSSLALPEVPLVQIATPHWVPPGAHTLQRGTQAALLWPRPRPKALGNGALFIEVDQQKLHPTRDQNHPHCGAKRVPQFAPGRRRQAALIALIPTL